jgi:serine/threonine protein kinase
VAAHKLLEKIHAAPRLLYYDKVGINDDNPTYVHLRMVLMKYLDGMTVNQAQKLDQLPLAFLEDVQRILSHLHDNNLVFGDVRSANIMITRNHKVKLLISIGREKRECPVTPFYCHNTYSGLTA